MRRFIVIPIFALALAVGWKGGVPILAPGTAWAACGSSTTTPVLALKKIPAATINWWECVDDNSDILDTQLVVEYVSSTATAGAATTLTDTTQSWSTDLWKNMVVKITGGTGSGQARSIASNTATVLTVSAAWTTNPDATSTYKILSGGGIKDHGLLTGLADDDHSQYHNDTRGDVRYYTKTLLDGGQMDNRYFTETEHLNSSAGAGDAGKPIKLDAAGHVDATMINDADVDHGTTTGLGDDDHTQYHNDTRGDARYYTKTLLDGGQLDNRYFTETEHLNSSAGAGDAGKPIKLDAGGQVDASMVNDGDIDHGSTGGLGDDDHTQYHTDARGDARYFTEAEHLNSSAGAGDSGKPIKLDAAGHVDATMINDADVDHGTTTGLADDDHTQYHTDARGDARYVELGGDTMTGLLVLSADPAAALGAATKQYVDAVGNITAIQFIIDGGGSAITTGVKGDLRIPFGCTINRVTMLADATGSNVTDIWKDTYANFPPTDADSITASAPPTITSSNKSEDTTLTSWTTSITAGDILRFNVDSNSTITRLTVSAKCTKS